MTFNLMADGERQPTELYLMRFLLTVVIWGIGRKVDRSLCVMEGIRKRLKMSNGISKFGKIEIILGDLN